MFLLCWISDQHLGRPPEPGPLLIMGHRYIWAGPLSRWWTQTQSRETHKPTGESTEGQQGPFGHGTWWTDGSNTGLMNELCKPLHLSRHNITTQVVMSCLVRTDVVQVRTSQRLTGWWQCVLTSLFLCFLWHRQKHDSLMRLPSCGDIHLYWWLSCDWPSRLGWWSFYVQ